VRDITKSFPGVLANDGVSFDVRGGEIHALVGENGAGKSTLMKILYGFYRPDAGEIRIEGRPVQIRSPHEARGLRIGMVFQEFVQIPALSVAENIALFQARLPAVLDMPAIVRRIEELSRRYRLEVDPRAPMWRLSVGERQKVEVLKLLLADARILIFDEPTRGLAPHEVAGLFHVFADLRRDGYAVVFITHKLAEALAGADRISVMRRGRIAGTLARPDATEDTLVSLMFGAAVASPVPRRRDAARVAEPLLELRNVSTRADGRAVSLRDIDLTVAPGEVVGVAGVSGNGQRELGDVILGLAQCARGAKFLAGADATGWSVARIRAGGVAFIPEDALAMAGIARLTVLENMALGDTRRYARHGGLAIDWERVRSDLVRSLARLGVPVPALGAPLGTLSGGTVQRVVLARELARRPKLIVAFYPTRGLDVRSATATRDLLAASRDDGAGVLLISEDLAELFALSDRLLVLFRGTLVGASAPADISVEEVGYLMTGARERHDLSA
jgi:simple sugar transport system ATP-binding protein